MKFYTASLVCLVVCLGYASAYGGWYGGQQWAPPVMVKVNASSIWVEKPAEGDLPKIGPSTSNNKEGLSLTDFCEYVLNNKDLPWGLSNLTKQEETFTDPWGNVHKFNHPRFPSLETVTNYCTNLKNNDYTFMMPQMPPRRFRRDVPNLTKEQKAPGL